MTTEASYALGVGYIMPAVIDASTSGDNTIVAAVSGKQIVVHQLFLMAAGTVTAKFESGAGGTAIHGGLPLVAQAGLVLPYSSEGWFKTAKGALLNLELSAAITVAGALMYSEQG